MKRFGIKVVAICVILQLSGLGRPLLAGAALVGTGAFLDARGQEARAGQACVDDGVRDFLARQEVRDAFVSLGVDPADVETRLEGLTGAELTAIHSGIADLPAGSDSALAIIGVVFLVLLILEIVGVTNIFKKV